jgi:hypothetical protein
MTTTEAGVAAHATPACRGHDPEIWFPLPSADTMEDYAIAICATCPVQVGCLGWAVAHGVRYGIWGGFNMERWPDGQVHQ